MKDTLHAQSQEWLETKRHTPEKMALAHLALEEIRDGADVFDAIKKHPIQAKGGGYIGKQMLVAAYNQLVESGTLVADPGLLARIRMKPVRTQSGVSVVTVLTKPYPCPGKCVFCPTDVRMPKSYLPDEPGAMRALHHEFDPYDQVIARLQQLQAVGHPIDKIEMLILGGTWSSYPRDYQEWFITRLFDAMNGVENADLAAAQAYNETAQHRNVGLVIETRPDHIDLKEIAWLRYLGVTKVQLGAQSFDDHILEINKRGHTVDETRQAVSLLRAAGFKLVLHWMPNLLGATPDSDRTDFAKLWIDFCPDEIKIYPNQLLENAELYLYWQRGEFQPYSTEELVDLLVDIKPTIPRYSRVNRVIRDIPSTNVVEGNKRTSLRMDVQAELKANGQHCNCLRCREVRGEKVVFDQLQFDDLVYQAGPAEEHFLSYVTPSDKISGFLRLSLPKPDSPATNLPDLEHAALVREVHVYGQSLEVGAEQQGASQHIGLGKRLLKHAEDIARKNDYARIAIIASVGTRQYYAARGYQIGETYMLKQLV